MYNQAKAALNSSNIQFGDKGEIVVGFRIVGRYEIVQEEAKREMGEAKFTPGPWEYNDRMGVVYGPNGWKVAHVFSFEGNGEADASLIVAAPEMYEALVMINEKALLWAEDNDDRDDARSLQVWLEEILLTIRQTLAKAQGGESS